MTLVLLRVPRGAEDYPICDNGREFIPFREDHTDPDSPWLIAAPPEAAHRLRHNAGFLIMSEMPPLSGGYSKMRNSLGTGCSWRGVSYEPDADGVVTVPAEAVHELLPHGFAPVPDEPKLQDAQLEAEMAVIAAAMAAEAKEMAVLEEDARTMRARK